MAGKQKKEEETILSQMMKGFGKAGESLVEFSKQVLQIRFCHENSTTTIVRALALIFSPLCWICGFIAFFFGAWHCVQGALAIVSGVILFVVEKPLFPKLCSVLRKSHPLKAWTFGVLSLPLFLSWYTVFAGIGLLSVASIHAFILYLPQKPDPTTIILAETGDNGGDENDETNTGDDDDEIEIEENEDDFEEANEGEFESEKEEKEEKEEEIKV